MKASHLFLFAITGVFGSLAQAQAPTENFNLSVYFAGNTCTTTSSNGTTTENCDVDPSNVLTNPNLSIPLSDCQSDGNGGTTCVGYWDSSMTMGTYSLEGVVNVSKSTDSANNVSYAVTVGVGLANGTGYAWAFIVPATPSLTDTTGVIGTSLPSTTDATVSYMPYLVVGPASQSQR